MRPSKPRIRCKRSDSNLALRLPVLLAMQKAQPVFMVHLRRGCGSQGRLTDAWECPSVKRELMSQLPLGSLPYSSREGLGTSCIYYRPPSPLLCITLVILEVFNSSQLYSIPETHRPTVKASPARTRREFMSFYQYRVR